MLTVLGGLAEFERELIRARTDEGRKRAQARGELTLQARKLLEPKPNGSGAFGLRRTLCLARLNARPSFVKGPGQNLDGIGIKYPVCKLPEESVHGGPPSQHTETLPPPICALLGDLGLEAIMPWPVAQ
jgi:hypothetical protein